MNAQYDIIRICIYETFHKNKCKIALHDNYGMQQFHITIFFSDICMLKVLPKVKQNHVFYILV